MERKSFKKAMVLVFVLIVSGSLLFGCSGAYYGAMEQMGFHKRDILVDRVEAARDAQSEAQGQFKSALEQFGSVVQIENTDLKTAYEQLNTEFESSKAAANTVSERIDKVESVAEDLFEEWADELTLYKSIELQNSSKQKLQETKTRYKEMLESMHRAESSMSPVLSTFQDNVLFLKHNLNAQAIGSLKTEFNSLKGEIDILMNKMNTAIEKSNQFIADIKQ